MREEEAQEIIACLPHGRTLFYCFKNRFSPFLLSYYVDEGKPTREIKQSHFAKLLYREILKPIIADLGPRPLTRELLDTTWPTNHEAYLLTLGIWGEKGRYWQSYYQTTRGGRTSLFS